MNNSLQTTDHHLPENIDIAISDFQKTLKSNTKNALIKGLSQSIQIQTHANNVFFRMHETIQKQVKDALELKDKKILGITILNKNLKSYNHEAIVQLFKEKLTNIPEFNGENKEDINISLFSTLNNLALYLSHSGTCITRQEYEEMGEIVKSKGTSFTINVLGPELASNIDKVEDDSSHRGRKYIKVKINFPKIFDTKLENNENIPTLEKLSEALILDGNKKLLPGNSSPEENENMDIKYLWGQIIKNESIKFKGYYSIGGKIHFPKSIPQEKIEEFEKKFGFESTGFQLIHANKSLLLPPSCSPNILLFYVLALKKFGLIEGEPDLQLSIPGRLPNWASGILGSAILLSGDTHTEYSQEAFSTNQDNLTGARIMAYDAGVLDNKFKHNSSNLKGRTDMLGIVDLNKAYTYHFLGSIISQVFYGGKYSKIGKEFMKEYIKLLDKHNLKWILEQERIYDNNNDNQETGNHHYHLIKTITDLQKTCREEFLQTRSKDGLIVFDIKNLLNKYQERLNYKK